MFLWKFQGRSCVVELSDSSCQRLHLGNDFWTCSSKTSRSRSPLSFHNDRLIVEVCVRQTTTFLDGTKRQHDFGLRLLDAQVRQECFDDNDSLAVRCLPVVHRTSFGAARSLESNVAAEQLVSQFTRLRVALTDDDQLLVGGTATIHVSRTPRIDRDGDGPVAVHDACQIRKINFLHDHVVYPNGTTRTWRVE